MKMKLKLMMAGVALTALTLTTVRADTKEIYEKNCTKCHGADGKGDTKMGKKLNVKDYTDAKVQAEMKDDTAFKSIKEGLKDKDDKTLMKPAENISDAEIKDLIALMRGFKK